jgi:LysM repeat protein
MRRLASLALVGGLLAGMALLVTPVRAAGPNQASVVHVVQWGETLFSIARHYGTSVEAISAANGIADPTHIYAGQRLTIPTAEAPPVPAAAGATHVVRPGENLYRIALHYGTTAQALAEFNAIYNPDHVVAGQTLQIPGSPTAPTVAYQPQHAATTHTVQPGETLMAVAIRYDVALWTLVQVNSIANPSRIFPGQALVIPRSGSLASASAPAPSDTGGGKRVVIDLSEQHLVAYQGGSLVYSFVASTGMPGASTIPGTFRVLDKIPNAYASTWGLQMPHWLGIYWAGSLENGIHALPILSNGQRLWEGYLGTPVSYGCIVLGTEEARKLYEWAEVGMPVMIRP